MKKNKILNPNSSINTEYTNNIISDDNFYNNYKKNIDCQNVDKPFDLKNVSCDKYNNLRRLYSDFKGKIHFKIFLLLSDDEARTTEKRKEYFSLEKQPKAAYEKIDENSIFTTEESHLHQHRSNKSTGFNYHKNNMIFQNKELKRNMLNYDDKEKEFIEKNRYTMTQNIEDEDKIKKGLNFSPLQNIFDTSYNMNYGKTTKAVSSKHSTANNFNKKMFSEFQNNEIQHYNRENSLKNLSIKIEIENIDKDIQKLQKKLKTIVEKKNI